MNKPPYAARFGNSFVVSDKVKNGSNYFGRYEYNELNIYENVSLKDASVALNQL